MFLQRPNEPNQPRQILGSGTDKPKKRIRIGIDGSSILPRRSGIGHYTSQLLRHLAQVDSINQYVVFFNSFRQPMQHEPWMDSANFSVRRRRIPGPALLFAWRWLHWPAVERFVGNVDMFHSPASYIPPQRRGARVTTIHDLYFMRDPEACEMLGGRYLLATLPRWLREMDRIIAISQSTRDDLIQIFGLQPERITVTYLGVEPSFGRVEDPQLCADVRARHHLPDRYILFVGTIEPRKNVERLIEAYATVRRERPDAPPLVIVGGRGKGADRVERAVASLGLSQCVIFAGYVERDDLPAIYSAAQLFVLPSLYEGFGLPVLEAMACQVPVVAGDTSSLREIVADRGVLVDPMRPSKIAEGIVHVLTDEGLRAHCVERGLEFARQMTWERCARQTLAVYEDVAAQTASLRKPLS
ncbi:glycosyltransferase family 4 protein [Candidatus Sumerlaeota bacterium]|nr:glycosyltransferase family 4 protein [Candidatus Sumerlaeota bacterium]